MKKTDQTIFKGKVLDYPRIYKNYIGKDICSFNMEINSVIEDNFSKIRNINYLPVYLKNPKHKKYLQKLDKNKIIKVNGLLKDNIKNHICFEALNLEILNY